MEPQIGTIPMSILFLLWVSYSMSILFLELSILLRCNWGGGIAGALPRRVLRWHRLCPSSTSSRARRKAAKAALRGSQRSPSSSVRTWEVWAWSDCCCNSSQAATRDWMTDGWQLETESVTESVTEVDFRLKILLDSSWLCPACLKILQLVFEKSPTWGDRFWVQMLTITMMFRGWWSHSTVWVTSNRLEKNGGPWWVLSNQWVHDSNGEESSRMVAGAVFLESQLWYVGSMCKHCQ